MASDEPVLWQVAEKRDGVQQNRPVGVTNSIALRAYQHRTGAGGEVTRKDGVTRLVWYEFHSDINKAIAREKHIKKWARQWKLELIESFNPEWTDLHEALNG